MKDHIVIRMFPSGQEPGLYYEIWNNEDGEIEDVEEDDGGICTSGDDKPDEPFTEEDWRNALEMAADQAIECLRKNGAIK